MAKRAKEMVGIPRVVFAKELRRWCRGQSPTQNLLCHQLHSEGSPLPSYEVSPTNATQQSHAVHVRVSIVARRRPALICCVPIDIVIFSQARQTLGQAPVQPLQHLCSLRACSKRLLLGDNQAIASEPDLSFPATLHCNR